MVRTAIRNVGIIGLGRMGRPIGKLLAARGFSVRGFDSDAVAIAAAKSLGIGTVDSCARLAALCDALIVAVGFDAQVEDALFGDEGVVSGAQSGTVVMIASTVAPAYMKSLAIRLEESGLSAIDAPVARGEAAAEAGSLLVFAGGDTGTVDRCRPVLESFSERIDYLGPAGAGQTAKAINNMLLWTCLCANVEGLDFGEAQGLDREALREALRHSSGANWALETRADARPALWAEKDMELLLNEAATAGIEMPVSETVRHAIAAFKRARGLPSPEMN